VHETADDLESLQALLDASHAAAGAHLATVFTAEHRLDAAGVAALLPGVQILSLATVTHDGRPLVAPVDGLFYRGRFYFGSSPESVRARHLRSRPAVSAAHVRGEELAVVVHGDAEVVDLSADEHAGFRRYLLDTYVPRYGPGWDEDVARGAWYARIEPRAMFTFSWPEPH
jgi:nitroimidazol reductase NimA-like FMN-containing flavoprotein (pyridoxamine 5'-phosphate oxidase superfamily)